MYKPKNIELYNLLIQIGFQGRGTYDYIALKLPTNSEVLQKIAGVDIYYFFKDDKFFCPYKMLKHEEIPPFLLKGLTNKAAIESVMFNIHLFSKKKIK